MSISAPRYAGSALQRMGRPGRVWSIFTNELRTRAGWATWAIVALSYIAVVLIVVIDTEFASLLGTVTLSTFHAPFASPVWPYLILLVATAVGSGSIADDLGSRSITLYLSRPIHLTDYLLAKTAAVATWIGLIAVGPGLVGVTIAAGLGLVSAPLALEAFAAFLGIGLLTTAFFTALSLALSTLTTRALYAGVAIFGVTLATDIASSAVYSATGNVSIAYLSPITDIFASAEAAFSTGATTVTVPATSAALLVAAAVILFVVTWVRLTRVEVVGE